MCVSMTNVFVFVKRAFSYLQVRKNNDHYIHILCYLCLQYPAHSFLLQNTHVLYISSDSLVKL